MCITVDELDEAHFPMVQEFPASEEAVPKHASLTAQSSRCSLNELLVDNDRENLHVEGWYYVENMCKLSNRND
jgi:hypothetical protein